METSAEALLPAKALSALADLFFAVSHDQNFRARKGEVKQNRIPMAFVCLAVQHGAAFGKCMRSSFSPQIALLTLEVFEFSTRATPLRSLFRL